tara:strand:+ start:6433 stop:7188 length:756 start_codon:yes stop_codon:yes gene_type:complete
VARQNRLTKRQKRILREEGVIDIKNRINPSKFSMIDVTRHYDLTDTQNGVIDAYDDEYNLVLHGVAGTGKTFLSIYLSLQDITGGHELYNKLYIVRSVVPTRDMGFLPGNWKQKAQVYEEPYKQIATELFNRGDAYEVLKNKNLVEFLTTSFIRGTTFNNCILLVDEINNMSFHELDSLITRVGKNCRIVLCGDYRQSDLTLVQEKKGLQQFLEVLNSVKKFKRFEFGINDIVRSDIVKDYIISKTELGYV